MGHPLALHRTQQFRRIEPIVEFERQARYALRVREVGIERFGPHLHASRRNFLDMFALRQSCAPNVPQRIWSGRPAAIFFNPFRSLFRDARMPEVA